MAVAIRSSHLRDGVNSVKWILAPVFAACWVLTYNSQYSKIFGYSAAAGFFSVVVFWAATSCPRLLTSRPLRLLGKYSYGIYIYHVILRTPVYDYFHNNFPGPIHKPLFFIAIFLVTFVMAYISLHSLEALFLRLKSRYFASEATA